MMTWRSHHKHKGSPTQIRTFLTYEASSNLLVLLENKFVGFGEMSIWLKVLVSKSLHRDDKLNFQKIYSRSMQGYRDSDVEAFELGRQVRPLQHHLLHHHCQQAGTY